MASILVPPLAFVLIVAVILLLGRRFVRWMFGGSAGTPEDPFRPQRSFGVLNGVLAAAFPISDQAKGVIDREMRQAGYYQPFARENYLSLRNAALLSWVVFVAFAMFAAFDPASDPTIPILVGGGVVGILLFAAPRLVLQSQASNRVRRIQRALPDGLDMLNMCVTGGLSLQTAFQRVSREIHTSHADLALEFDIVRRHSETYTLEHALELFANRVDVPDVKAMTAVVTQSERMGTNVGSALQEYADSMRLNQRQRAEEQGNKRSVQMLFPVALCLAPPVYILLLAPGILELYDFVKRENQQGGILSQNLSSIQTAAPARAAPAGPAAPAPAPQGSQVGP